MAIIKGKVNEVYYIGNLDMQVRHYNEEYFLKRLAEMEEIKNPKDYVRAEIEFSHYKKYIDKEIPIRLYKGEYLNLDGISYEIEDVEFEDGDLIYCINNVIEEVENMDSYNHAIQRILTTKDYIIKTANKELEKIRTKNKQPFYKRLLWNKK